MPDGPSGRYLTTKDGDYPRPFASQVNLAGAECQIAQRERQQRVGKASEAFPW